MKEAIFSSTGVGSGEGKAQVAAVLVPMQAGDHAERQLRRAAQFARAGLHQVQGARAVFIDRESEGFAVGRKVEGFNVPLDCGRKYLLGFGG